MRAELVDGTLRLISDWNEHDVASRRASMEWCAKGLSKVELVLAPKPVEDFRRGSQWTADEISRMEKRPASPFNMIRPTLDDRSLAQRDVLDHVAGMPTPERVVHRSSTVYLDEMFEGTLTQRGVECVRKAPNPAPFGWFKPSKRRDAGIVTEAAELVLPVMGDSVVGTLAAFMRVFDGTGCFDPSKLNMVNRGERTEHIPDGTDGPVEPDVKKEEVGT